MTDKEKLRQLLTEFGIGFGESADRIAFRSGNTKVADYGLFVVDFEFTNDGKFLQIEISE